MQVETKKAVHWSFWVIAAVGLIWNMLGAFNFVNQMNPETLASLPESHQAIVKSRPDWATIAFAVAVFGGWIGCLLLLMRRSASMYLLTASLLGVLVQMIPNIGMVGANIKGPFEITMMMVLPLVLGAFLVRYSIFARRKGWLR